MNKLEETIRALEKVFHKRPETWTREEVLELLKEILVDVKPSIKLQELVKEKIVKLIQEIHNSNDADLLMLINQDRTLLQSILDEAEKK